MLKQRLVSQLLLGSCNHGNLLTYHLHRIERGLRPHDIEKKGDSIPFILIVDLGFAYHCLISFPVMSDCFRSLSRDQIVKTPVDMVSFLCKPSNSFFTNRYSFRA